MSSCIYIQIRAEISSSDICFGSSCRSGWCMLFSSWLPVSSLFVPLLSITDQSHSIKYDLIWEKSLRTEKEAEGGTERIQHEWNISESGEEMEKVMVLGGGGDETQLQSRPFEEPVENVGTTSKEHHEICNTPPPPLLLLLLLLWLENLLPSGVVFLNWLFSVHVHRSSCEMQAAGIQIFSYSS